VEVEDGPAGDLVDARDFAFAGGQGLQGGVGAGLAFGACHGARGKGVTVGAQQRFPHTQRDGGDSEDTGTVQPDLGRCATLTTPGTAVRPATTRGMTDSAHHERSYPHPVRASFSCPEAGATASARERLDHPPGFVPGGHRALARSADGTCSPKPATTSPANCAAAGS
jgi:hypothetical protein